MYSTLERTVSLLKRMPSGKITQAILFIWFWICLNHSLVQRPSSKVVDSCILFAYFFPNLILVCSSVNWLIKSLSVCVCVCGVELAIIKLSEVQNIASVSHLRKLHGWLLFQEDGSDLDCQCEEEEVFVDWEETINVTSEHPRTQSSPVERVVSQSCIYQKPSQWKSFLLLFWVYYIYIVFLYTFLWSFKIILHI